MKTTLSDIAKKMGVSPSTIQRALNGSPGVSAALRQKIMEEAEKMDYRPNLYASSLKRGAKRMAVILPDLDRLNRYYAYYIWQGIHIYMQEAASMNIEVVRIPVVTQQDQRDCLKKVLAGEYGAIDGVITRGIRTDMLDTVFERLQSANIPVVLVGTDIESKNRLCCVKNYDAMQGRMAADLLINFGDIKAPGKVIVCGNFTGSDQYHNAKGFEEQVWESKKPLNIYKISYDVDPAQIRDAMLRELEGNPVYAMYACSTRSTLAMCEVVKAAGLGGKVHTIGSDIFKESAGYLKEGVLKAIVHSRPTMMAYQAAQVLVSYWMQGEIPQDRAVFIDPCIAMKGNIDFYINTLPHFDQEDRVESIEAVEALKASNHPYQKQMLDIGAKVRGKRALPK